MDILKSDNVFEKRGSKMDDILYRIGEYSLRDFELSDVDAQVNYLFHSPPGYMESLSIDVTKFKSEPEYRAFLTAQAELPTSKKRFMCLVKNEKSFGIFLINELIEDESAQAHWHIWDARMRSEGIATKLALPAIQIIVERFHLKALYGKIPVDNPQSIRAVEKLGGKFMGEETISGPLLKGELLVRCYRLF